MDCIKSSFSKTRTVRLWGNTLLLLSVVLLRALRFLLTIPLLAMTNNNKFKGVNEMGIKKSKIDCIKLGRISPVTITIQKIFNIHQIIYLAVSPCVSSWARITFIITLGYKLSVLVSCLQLKKDLESRIFGLYALLQFVLEKNNKRAFSRLKKTCFNHKYKTFNHFLELRFPRLIFKKLKISTSKYTKYILPSTRGSQPFGGEGSPTIQVFQNVPNCQVLYKFWKI